MALQSRLLQLPRELRDHIVSYLFDDLDKDKPVALNRYYRYGNGDSEAALSELPPICRTSARLYFEATPAFLARITPVMDDVMMTIRTQKWLATFPSGIAFRAILQLAFRNFHGPEQFKGYELAAMCPNLESLDIMFGDGYGQPGTLPSLAIKSLSSSYNAYESLDNIVLMHQLYKLTTLPSLKRLIFGFHDWETRTSSQRARQVLEWLNTRFRAKGQVVHVKCSQMT